MQPCGPPADKASLKNFTLPLTVAEVWALFSFQALCPLLVQWELPCPELSVKWMEAFLVGVTQLLPLPPSSALRIEKEMVWKTSMPLHLDFLGLKKNLSRPALGKHSSYLWRKEGRRLSSCSFLRHPGSGWG